MNNIISNFSPNDIDEVVKVINSSFQESRKEFVVSLLIKAKAKLKPTPRELFENILSVAATSTLLIPNTRFNCNKISAESIIQANTYINDILSTKTSEIKYHLLPFNLQLLIKYCSSYTYKFKSLSYINILGTVKKFNTTEVVVKRCKRCNTTLHKEEIICTSCMNKIVSCVEFACNTFSTHGTSVEDFQVSFKNWVVDVKSSGEYTFLNIERAKEQYQQSLPFKEYQKLLVLIG